MPQLPRTLRQAVRLLWREPLFSAATLGVLAAGIGASTAMLSVVDAILFRPLALPDSERVVAICETHPSQGHCTASPPNVADWAVRSHALAAVGVGRTTSLLMRGGEGSRGVAGGIATPGFFAALGARPLAGRLLADDDLPPRAAGRVAVVSEAFWREALGGDPGVLGRKLVLDEEPHTVVGVLADDTYLPWKWVEVWRPLPFDPRDEENRGWRGFMAVGRLAAGATPAAAAKEHAALQGQLAGEHPEELRGWGADVVRLRDRVVGEARPALLLFLGAAGLLLLVVCASTASLLIARGAARDSELALRTALGATTAHAVGPLLVETALLAALGAAGGVVVGWAGVRAFVALAPAGIPRVDEVTVDLRLVTFAAAAALLTGLAVGLALLARQRRLQPGRALHGSRGGGGEAEGRLRRALVVTQLALAVMLVVTTGLLTRSLGNLLAWDPGFDTAGVLSFQLFLSEGRHTAPEQVLAVYRQVESRLARLPGVAAVGTASAPPLLGGGDGRVELEIAGQPPTAKREASFAAWFDVGPTYFPALGVPVIAGRGLTERDDAGAPGALLVNQTLARRLAPDGSPLGLRLRLSELDFAGEVVGVVADVTPLEAGQPVEAEIYLPNRQRTRWATYFVLRSRGDAAPLGRAVELALAEVDSELSPSRLQTLEEALSGHLRRPRFHVALVGSLAVVAMLLGAAGVYGVVAYTVSRRSRAIAVRLALGARRWQVVGEVLADGLRLVGAGAAAGLLGGIATARLAGSMLHGVAPYDPVALAATVMVLAAVGVLACWVPALQASRIDPGSVLRGD